MYYKSNVNKIHTSLLGLFNDCDVDDKNKNLLFRGKAPLNENINNNLEIVLEVSKNDITNSDSNIEWGYYTNSKSLDNKIVFNTTIETIPSILEDVIQKNKLSVEYINFINSIEESEDGENAEIPLYVSINETYSLNTSVLNINKKKLKRYLKEKHDLDITNIVTRYRNLTNGSLINTDYVVPKLGDEAEITLEISNNLDTNQILKLNEDIRKISRVENFNIIKNNIIFNFDSRVLVVCE